MKRFLSDPDRGRPKEQLFQSLESPGSILEPHLDNNEDAEGSNQPTQDQGSQSGIVRRTTRRDEDAGKMVDVVLSDMSAPWDQTTGFWKRSLSDPYNRMMNTSGIAFKDHAGSMVGVGSLACPTASNTIDNRIFVVQHFNLRLILSELEAILVR